MLYKDSQKQCKIRGYTKLLMSLYNVFKLILNLHYNLLKTEGTKNNLRHLYCYFMDLCFLNLIRIQPPPYIDKFNDSGHTFDEKIK